MQAQGGPPTCRITAWQAAALIGILALGCHWPSLGGGLLWDDAAHITSPGLRSLAGLGRIWTDLHATQQYYPLLHSAFWLEHRLWGDAMAGYHLANVLLHAAAACLLVLILRRLNVPGALLAGLLFAVHPVCVESVAWVSEQKNTLSLVFYLLAALAYLRFDGRRGGPGARSAYAQASLLFAAALLTKTVTATLPAALLVVLWWRRGSLSWRRDVLPLVPWFAAAAASGLLTAWVERTIIGAEGAAYDLTVWQRCLLAGRVIWFYLGKVLWPTGLVFIYPHWDLKTAGAGWLGCLAAAVAVTAGLWLVRRLWRGPLAAWLFFVGSLFPALGFFNVFPFTFSYVADHFQYLACIGVITACSAGIALALARAAPAVRAAGWAGCGALVAGLGVISFLQSGTYADARTLYQTTLSRNPGCWLAHNNLGKILLDLNSPAALPEAVAHFRAALRLHPDFPQAHTDLGSALDRQGRPLEAIAEHEAAIRLMPGFAEAHYNLGAALRQIPGRLQEAISEYQEAVRLKPDYAAARNNLGNALVAAGRTPEAIIQFAEALKRDPGSAETHNNLGLALDGGGRTLDAVAEYGEALRLNPDFAAAHYNLGGTLRKVPGRLNEAVAQYEAALRLEPDNAAVRNNLGNALAAAGRGREAIVQLEEALRLDPSLADAHNNLGSVLDSAGRTSEAITQYEASLRLRPDVAETHYNLGIALQETPGRTGEAVVQYGEALRLKPGYVEARYNLAVALGAQGRVPEAAAQYREVLRLRPGLAEAHNNLGSLLQAGGRTAEAIAEYEEAVRLKPGYVEAHYNLAFLLLKVPGRSSEAAEQLEATLRLQPGNEAARRALAEIRGSPR